MPNISSHMAVAVKVSEILEIDDPLFIEGNLLPDLYRNKEKSHFKKMGKKYLVPNIEYVKSTFDLSNKLYLGYLVHLLLDKYYLEDYLLVRYPSKDVFEDKKIYNDYDILNKDIIDYFNMNIEYLENTLSKININGIDRVKLQNNIKFLRLNKDGDLLYLNKEDFLTFLNDIALKIVNEIKEFV